MPGELTPPNSSRKQKARAEVKFGPVPKGRQRGTKDDNGKEQTFYSSTDGSRQKKTLANVYKILSANRVSNYYEFNSANQMYVPGKVPMYSNATTSAAGQLPVHMIDLTACPNVVGGSIVNGTSTITTGTLSSATTMTPYHCFLNTVTTAAGAQQYWYPVTEDLPLQLVSSPQTQSTTDSYPMGKDQLVWSQIKLNLYGCNLYPLTYKVYFIKLKKDYLHMSENVLLTAGQGSGTADEVVERNAFWNAISKPLLYNPILPQDSKHWKDVTVLKSDTFHIAPKLSTESDTVPHVKTVSYFERWNLDLNYAWQDETTIATTSTNNTQIDLGETKTTVQHKDRVLMLITCENFTAPGSYSSTTNGSYDIMVKCRHDRVI